MVGVVTQGMAAGGTTFVLLEGCIYDQQSMLLTSKVGGAAQAGQVFRLDLEQDTLELIYESTGYGSFSGPDNIIISPGGSLMICENRLGLFDKGQYIAGPNAADGLFAFCQINSALRASFAGHDLNATAVSSEWAGVCFLADGE